MVLDHILKAVAVSIEQVQIEFHKVSVGWLLFLKQIDAQIEIFIRSIDLLTNHIGNGQIVKGYGLEHVDVARIVPFQLVHEILTFETKISANLAI